MDSKKPDLNTQASRAQASDKQVESGSTLLDDLQRRSSHFLESVGRRPRVLLAHMDKTASQTHLRASASVFADAGFDVDIGPCASDHHAVARMAVENDVHVVSVAGCRDHNKTRQELDRALAGFEEEAIRIFLENERTDADRQAQEPGLEEQAIRSAALIFEMIGD